MSEKIRYLKFRGRGQGETPVGDIYVVVEVIMLSLRGLHFNEANGEKIVELTSLSKRLLNKVLQQQPSLGHLMHVS